MVKLSEKQLSNTLSALSDPTRRDILKRLLKNAQSVTEIAKPYKMSLPAVSKHIRVLENAKLVTRNKQGREYYFLPDLKPLGKVRDQLAFYEKYWNQKLDNLEKYLTKEKKQ